MPTLYCISRFFSVEFFIQLYEPEGLNQDILSV
jgi:hypothetical protein